MSDWLAIILGISIVLTLIISLLRGGYLWLLILGISLLISGILSGFNWSVEGESPMWGIVNPVLSVAMIGSYFFIRNEQKQVIRFTDWLIRNQDVLAHEPVSYNGMRLSLDTELVSFQICASFLRSTRFTSRVLIKGYYDSPGVQIICSLITLCFGWWSLSGLIYTPLVLYRNICGGEQFTVSEQIGKLRLMGAH